MNSKTSSQPDPRRDLFEFVLEKSEGEPPSRRIRILRALAQFAGAPDVTGQINALADDLESAQARYLELSLHFRDPKSSANGFNA